MIKVEKIEPWGFEHAIRGMRNPKNSWDRSDSEEKYWCTTLGPNEETHYCNNCGYDACHPYEGEPEYVIGQNDLDLMKRLYKAGPEHRTYARMIQVSMDITAPLYWWKEMDRYTIGKSQVSCSTMHKIHAKEFELDDFSWEQLLCTGCDLFLEEFGRGNFIRKVQPIQLLTNFILPSLNVCREKYLETGNKDYWWQIIQLLPSSYNQKRTICMSYETVFKIIRERTGHKLDEWRNFVDILKDLPYVREIIDEADNIRRVEEDSKAES